MHRSAFRNLVHFYATHLHCTFYLFAPSLCIFEMHMTKIAHNKNQRSRTKRVREGRGHNTNHGWLARMSFPRLLQNYHMPGFSRNIRENCFAFKSFTRLWHKLVHYGDIRSSDYASAFKNSIIRCMSRVTFAEIESAALRLHSPTFPRLSYRRTKICKQSLQNLSNLQKSFSPI